MKKLGHVIKHLFNLNLSEVAYGHVNGHTWYGMKCLEDGCDRWEPTAHSLGCFCRTPRPYDAPPKEADPTVANLLFRSLPPAAKQALFDAMQLDVSDEVSEVKYAESLVPRDGVEPPTRRFSIPMSCEIGRRFHEFFEECCISVVPPGGDK